MNITAYTNDQNIANAYYKENNIKDKALFYINYKNLDFGCINEKKEIQIRKELNGWSSDKTAETYNLRHIREEADRVMREDMDHWTNRAKKDN